MQFSERKLEDWMIENPKAFSEVGEFRWLGRQVKVASGIIDLLGLSKWDADDGAIVHLHVIELKSCDAKSEHVAQVCRYAADIENTLPVYGSIQYSVFKTLITVGSPIAQVQYEADAMDVELRTVEPIFSLSGAWHFNDEARESHTSINDTAFDKFIEPVVISILDALSPKKPDRGSHETPH